MCKKVPTTVELLQTNSPWQTGDSQHNLRQYGHSLVQDMNPEPPIFEAVIPPLRAQYMSHTTQEKFCSTLTSAIIIDHVKLQRTFT
jgi:hypothetical protein